MPKPKTPSRKAKDGLTPKQARFVSEYLKDLNATKAAVRAGYSAKSAEQIGYQLLHKTPVAAEIALGQEKAAEKAGLSVERVVTGLLTEAEFVGEGATHGARVAAWGHLGKHLGMFVEKVDLNITGALAERLEALRARRAGRS